nr:hypothetical protein [Thioalkalivibrio paradoxus]
MRRAAFMPPRSRGAPQRRLADDGLRPFPPYRSPYRSISPVGRNSAASSAVRRSCRPGAGGAPAPAGG